LWISTKVFYALKKKSSLSNNPIIYVTDLTGRTVSTPKIFDRTPRTSVMGGTSTSRARWWTSPRKKLVRTCTTMPIIFTSRIRTPSVSRTSWVTSPFWIFSLSWKIRTFLSMSRARTPATQSRRTLRATNPVRTLRSSLGKGLNTWSAEGTQSWSSLRWRISDFFFRLDFNGRLLTW
jgi:hypothetical protein